MAFVVQCPFCKLKAKVPDRALGGIGHCPRCGNAFSLAAAEDGHLPESVAQENSEPAAEMTVGAAIAVAAAVAEANDPIAAGAPDPAYVPARSAFHPASAVGALAFLLSGLALVASSVSWLRAAVLPVSVAALAAGLAAIVIACLSAKRRWLLPLVGSAAAAAMLIVAGLFPALLGPAYEHQRKRPELIPMGLQAIPLAGAPALAELPEWVDAKRYALRRDGLRVQVIRVSLLPPDKEAKTAPHKRLLIRVRVSQEKPGVKSIERKEEAVPIVRDEMGAACVFVQSEFLDFGGRDKKSGLFAVPTIEETFVFAAPLEEHKAFRMELPAARWGGTDVFRFAIEMLNARAKQ